MYVYENWKTRVGGKTWMKRTILKDTLPTFPEYVSWFLIPVLVLNLSFSPKFLTFITVNTSVFSTVKINFRLLFFTGLSWKPPLGDWRPLHKILDIILSGLSLLLVLALTPRVFLRVLWFSSLQKSQFFQIPIRSGNSRATGLSVVDYYVLPLLNKVDLFIHLFSVLDWK